MFLFYYSFCHPHSPAARVEPGHNPTGGVVHLHHRLGRVDVHVDHVEVDHGRGRPPSAHHVAGHVAVRTVALSRSKRLGKRERGERSGELIIQSVATHLQLGHDLAGVAGRGAYLHSELLSQPGDGLGHSFSGLGRVSNERCERERERERENTPDLALLTFDHVGVGWQNLQSGGQGVAVDSLGVIQGGR